MIIAGAHSLGTGAACMAATRTDLIEKIEDSLPRGYELDYHKKGMWVLVKAVANKAEDWYVEPDRISIERVELY